MSRSQPSGCRLQIVPRRRELTAGKVPPPKGQIGSRVTRIDLQAATQVRLGISRRVAVLLQVFCSEVKFIGRVKLFGTRRLGCLVLDRG